MSQPLETSIPDSSPPIRRGKSSLPGLRPATSASEAGLLSTLLEQTQPAPPAWQPAHQPTPPAPEPVESGPQALPLNPGGAAWDGTERREHSRFQSAALVTVVPVHMTLPDSQHPGETPRPRQFQGKLIDISRNGVAFLLPQPLPVALRVYLRIANYRINENLDTVGEVLRVTPVDTLFHQVVCTFGYLLGEDQVNAFRRHLGDAWLV